METNSTTMSLETLWRLLEAQQRLQNGSVASVVGLDEAKLLVENQQSKHGMTTFELIVVQSVLLSGLVIFSVIWAFFCKKRCIGDETLAIGMTRNMAALARKLSSTSTRTLPPSYSKVDLTSVGLTLSDHLNPPPSYDRIIAMLESGEITSVPIHLHPEVERRMSLASSSGSSRRTSRSSSSRSSSRKSSRKHSISDVSSIAESSAADESRKTSRVTFAPNLIQDDSDRRKASSQSLPLHSVLCHPERKKSTKSEGTSESRKVSFIDQLTGFSARPNPEFERQLQTQLEIVKEAGEMGEFVHKPDEAVREDRKMD